MARYGRAGRITSDFGPRCPILKLLTLRGLGIWYLIDLIMVLVGATKDKNGLPLAGYEANKKTAWIIRAIVFVLGGASSAVNAAAMSANGVLEGPGPVRRGQARSGAPHSG